MPGAMHRDCEFTCSMPIEADKRFGNPLAFGRIV
jgi:hypothetical protein